MSVRDRIVGKQGIDQMMARMDDELRGIAGGYTWSTLENTNKCKGLAWTMNYVASLASQ